MIDFYHLSYANPSNLYIDFFTTLLLTHVLTFIPLELYTSVQFQLKLEFAIQNLRKRNFFEFNFDPMFCANFVVLRPDFKLAQSHDIPIPSSESQIPGVEFQIPDVRSKIPSVPDVRFKILSIPDVWSKVPSVPDSQSQVPDPNPGC